MPEHSREDAYRLSTPDEHRDFYDAWSATYDTDFIQALGYQVPAVVARAFLAHAGAGEAPIADIGCGTGQLGRALGRDDVDGFDLSPGMLAAAAASGAYRHLHQVDLTAAVVTMDGRYAGLVSSGTFTHGHLGPTELAGILRLGRPGALCAIGINAEYYSTGRFEDFFTAQRSSQRLTMLSDVEVHSYTDGQVPDEPVNRTRVVVFRLAG